MFNSASMKLGLDRAVLAQQRATDEKGRSKRSSKEQAQEIDTLLKKGAYDVFRDDDDEEEESLNSSGWSGDLLDASDSVNGAEFNTMAMMMNRAAGSAVSSNEDGRSIVKVGSTVSIPSLSAASNINGPSPKSPLPVPPPPLSVLQVPAASSSSLSSSALIGGFLGLRT